ncbi:MAG: serine hydroxymethyltransferase [Patescibacteria group bacterium]
MNISDLQISSLIDKENTRQQSSVTLIPSENHTSKDVLAALATTFSDKYAEGYPGRRYYAGNSVADELETLVQNRAKALFSVPYVNVQPYSGSPANLAILFSIAKQGDTILGLDYSHGGHLTHGYAKSATGSFWKGVQYHLKPDGYIDLDEVRTLAKQHKPRVIICGGTAVPRAIPFKAFSEIADEVGALLLADISHIAGLVVGGAHESPVPYADIVMTTTHKTLRGPRGAMIMVTDRGLAKDPEMGSKIDKAVIPGLQGGPHLNTIAGIGVALYEAAQPSFKDYAKNVVKNAKTLADALIGRGFSLVSGGTDNHLILIDLTPTGVARGTLYHETLETVGIITNRNTIPNDPSSPFYPSGLRIGSPAATTRGMSNEEMKRIANWIADVGEHIRDVQVPGDKEARKAVLDSFRATLASDSYYKTLHADVKAMCETFPVPGVV